MTSKPITIAPMVTKTEYIQIRLSAQLKRAIEKAAEKRGRTVSNYMIWAAAQMDKGVARVRLDD
jgi:uncharacterized protein (DUF1778 family)